MVQQLSKSIASENLTIAPLDHTRVAAYLSKLDFSSETIFLKRLSISGKWRFAKTPFVVIQIFKTFSTRQVIEKNVCADFRLLVGSRWQRSIYKK